MKKIIRIVLVFIFAIGSFAVILSCGNTDAQEPHGGDIMLVDFENYAPDFSLCRISSDFGKVSVNTDKTFVKSGSRSARIDPVGNGWMYFPTYSERYDFDYTDFTYVRCVRLEMYNPQENDKTVRVGLIAKINSIDLFDRACEATFTLESGWNTIEYYVAPDIVCMTADITDIQGISLSFEQCNAWDIDDTTPRYYVDDVKLVKSTVAHATESNIEFAPNEIIDFEKFYHNNFIINDFGIEMDIVKTADYGIATATGSRALRVVIPKGNSGRWNYYVKIMAPFLQASALGKLSDEQFENGYFTWDSYNGADSEYNCAGLFFVGSGTTSYAVGSYPKPSEWVTHKVKLTDIEANIPGWRGNVGMFVFSIKDSFSTDRELFLDNFRIEYSE